MKRILTALALAASSLVAAAPSASADPVNVNGYTFDLPPVVILDGHCTSFSVTVTKADGLPLRMSAQAKVIDANGASLGVAFVMQIEKSGQTVETSTGSIGCDSGELVAPFQWQITLFTPTSVAQQFFPVTPEFKTTPKPTPTPTPTATPTPTTTPTATPTPTPKWTTPKAWLKHGLAKTERPGQFCAKKKVGLLLRYKQTLIKCVMKSGKARWVLL